MKTIMLFVVLLFSQNLFSQYFTLVPPPPPFSGVDNGALAFEDVNGDSHLDVLVSGSSDVGFISKLYLNDRLGNFSEVTGTPFEGVQHSAVAFADVDGDNDKDVLITGQYNFVTSAASSKLYLNDGSGNFNEVPNTPFDNVDRGTIDFEDVNGDSHPDLLITGRESSGGGYIAKLYTNDGSGNFTELSGTPFQGIINGSVDFVDVDGDSDSDVLITGGIGGGAIAKLYLNDGNGNFSEVAGTPFEIVANSEGSFIDVNGDTYPDILISGNSLSGPISQLFLNDGNGNFSLLSGTPFIGVQQGSHDFTDINSDNHVDILITGLDNTGTRHSSLYLNDGAGNFSLLSNTPFPGLNLSSSIFADINGDLYPDLMLAGREGTNSRISKLYTNDGRGNFSEVTGTPFGRISHGSTAFEDIDNDGDQDLFITGSKSANSGGGAPSSLMYINDGSGNYTQAQTSNFEPVAGSSIAFADVNNDTYPDVLIAGEANALGSVTLLYTNDGNGNFTEVAGTPFEGLSWVDVEFADVDGDTSPDLLMTGLLGQTPVTKLYVNDGSGNFSEVSNTPFIGMFAGSIAFADVNSNGHLDLLMAGKVSTLSEVRARLYLNDGTGNFTEVLGTPFEGAGLSSVAFFDVNSDTFQDVLITGQDNSFKPIAKLYINDGNGNFTEMANIPFPAVQDGSITIAGFVADGYEDVLITGLDSSSTRITVMFSKDSNGNYNRLVNTPFEGVSSSSITHADVNGDGELDVFLTGINNAGLRLAYLYHGEISLSSKNNPEKKFLLYPNPVRSGTIFMEYESTRPAELEISLMDVQGRTWVKQYSSIGSGLNRISMDLANATHGLYLLRISDGTRVMSKKLIIHY